MSVQVNIHEAKTRLSQLVAACERGEDVVLARAGKPVVRMVLVERDRAAVREERLAWMGSVKTPMSDPDIFLEPAYTDAELDEFEAKFEGPGI